MVLRSPSMARPPYWVSKKSTNWFRSWWGGQHRQDGDLISLHFSFRKKNRLKIHKNIRTISIQSRIKLHTSWICQLLYHNNYSAYLCHAITLHCILRP
jgi:hypothetical protein